MDFSIAVRMKRNQSAARQVLYECYFQGNWLWNATLLLGIYDREPLMRQVREFLMP